MKRLNSLFLSGIVLLSATASAQAGLEQEVSSIDMSAWLLGTVLSKLFIYIAFAMTVGGLAALLNVSRYKDRQNPLIRYLSSGCLLGLIAVSAQFFLKVGSFAEEGLAGMWDSDYAAILWQSEAGQSYQWQLIAWCLIVFLTLLMWLKPALTSTFATVGLIGVFMIAASFTLTGHTAEGPIWVRLALVLHVVTAMWWIGSLYPLRRACSALDIPTLKSLMVEFGQQAMFLVGLLVVAGVVVSYHLEGSISNLLYTAHGNLLLLKLGTVAAILLVAARHKLRMVPSLNSIESVKSLKRSIAIEMWIGLFILLLTAVLSTVIGPATLN